MAEQAAIGQMQFALMIYGTALDMEALDAQLALTHTRCVRKGDVLNRLPRLEATEDLWAVEIALSNPEGTDEELNALLATLTAHRDALAALSQTCRVLLRMYVHSDRAQIAYRLMPETLQRLCETGLPLDVTSLSWGEIGL